MKGVICINWILRKYRRLLKARAAKNFSLFTLQSCYNRINTKYKKFNLITQDVAQWL